MDKGKTERRQWDSKEETSRQNGSCGLGHCLQRLLGPAFHGMVLVLA